MTTRDQLHDADTERRSCTPFNTPFETGLRALIILVACYPKGLSHDRAVFLDHVVAHTADWGGPPSLHPASPLRIAEPLVRRELVRRGLLLMTSRGLAEELPSADGFQWRAGDKAGPFLEFLSAPYFQQLTERATWAVRQFASLSDAEVTSLSRERLVEIVEMMERRT